MSIHDNLSKAKAGGMSLDLLWENPDHTSSFAAQDVTVSNMANYTFLMFVFKFRCSNGQQMTQLMPNSDGMGTLLYYMTTNKFGRRIAKRVDATTITFETGSYDGSNNDEYGVPVKVYGIKCGINDIR